MLIKKCEYKRDKYLYHKILILSFLAFALPLILYIVYFNDGFSRQQEHWAEFGSYFGGFAGSVFSFLSFLLLLVSYFKQREDIQRLRNENDKLKAKETSKELERELKDIVIMLSSQIESQKPYFERHINSVGRENIKSYPGFFDIKFLFDYMNDVITELESLNPELRILDFYRRKYSIMIGKLSEKHIIDISNKTGGIYG